MAKKGLTRETILGEAKQMIKESGYEEFSLRGLARNLGIKTASLYNHIENMNEIKEEIIVLILEEMDTLIRQKMEGAEKKQAMVLFAEEYRRYALENPQLYRMILLIPSMNNRKLEESSYQMMDALYSVLRNYYEDVKERIYFGRMFRSGIHGFIGLEQSGYFSYKENIVKTEECFNYLVSTMLGQLEVKNDKK